MNLRRHLNLILKLFSHQAGKVMSYVSKVMNYKHYITFKGLQATMDKLNSTTEKHPIPGMLYGADYSYVSVSPLFLKLH